MANLAFKSIILTSFLAIISLSLSSLLFRESSASDFARPLVYAAFALVVLASRGKPFVRRLSYCLALTVLVIGLLQSILVFFQFFYPSASLVEQISRIFARSSLVDITMMKYSRALGIFGGPAPSGVFAVSVYLISIYMERIRVLPPRVALITKSSQWLSVILMSSKGAAFVLSAIAMSDLSWLLRCRFGSRILGANLFRGFVFASVFIVLVASLVVFADASSLREQKGVLFAIGGLFRTSSFYGRLEFIDYGLNSLDRFELIIFGSGLAPSALGPNRVFDSDFLYFFLVYGVAGIMMFFAFIILIESFRVSCCLDSFVLPALVLGLVFNPNFTATYAFLPFIFALSLPFLMACSRVPLGASPFLHGP